MSLSHAEWLQGILFSARGLQDDTLESMVGHLPEMFGNIHHGIQQIAQSIRKLSLLTPPDSLYKDVSDERLYQMAIDEANSSDNRVQLAYKKLSDDPQNVNATRFFSIANLRTVA
jgi:hypothetical protein